MPVLGMPAFLPTGSTFPLELPCRDSLLYKCTGFLPHSNAMKTKAPSILIIVSVVCIGLLPEAQAVSPPPDGGYPGGNTAEGQSALLSLTSGGFNTAVGFFSLRSDTTGELNTAVGAGALL